MVLLCPISVSPNLILVLDFEFVSTTQPTWMGLAEDAKDALDKVTAEEIHDNIFCNVFDAATRTT